MPSSLIIRGNSCGMIAAWMVLSIIAVVSGIFFIRGRLLLETRLKENLQNTAAAAAMQFDGATIEQIRKREDMDKPVFHETVQRLSILRNQIPRIRFAYIMRTTEDPMTLEFVADADALLEFSEQDSNGNGTIEPDEELSLPGDLYDITDVPALQHEAFLQPSVDEEVTTDQWGNFISGYAPIIREDTGEVVAVLGIDMTEKDFFSLNKSIFSLSIFFLILLGALNIAWFIVLATWKQRSEAVHIINDERRSMMLLASHQLGEPLTILKWSLEEALGVDPTRRIEDIRDELDRMNEGVTRLNTIVNTMHEVLDIDAGTLPYHPAPTNLGTLVERVRAAAASTLEWKSQTLRVEGTQDCTLTIDAKRIQAVLQELIFNASTFSPPNTTISVRAERTSDAVRIDVSDQGSGIEPSDLPRIFNRFVRGANAAHIKPDGNGLGLYMVRGIIQRAGGRVWVKSTVNKGTTISFTLPRSAA